MYKRQRVDKTKERREIKVRLKLTASARPASGVLALSVCGYRTGCPNSEQVPGFLDAFRLLEAEADKWLARGTSVQAFLVIGSTIAHHLPALAEELLSLLCIPLSCSCISSNVPP